MKRWIFLVVLLPLCAHAVVYRWIDEHGHAHYTDKYRKGATLIQLKPIPTYRFSSSTKSVAMKPAVAIVQPRSQQTIRNSPGDIPITIAVIPSLQRGKYVAITMDGHAVGTLREARKLHLHNVPCGTHTLQAHIVNAKRERIANSGAVVVHLHRPRINRVVKPKSP